MPERFSWVIENTLAGMERPGLFFDLEEDLGFLREKGVDVIVNLEEKEYSRDYGGFIVKHIPIEDFGAPRLKDFEEFIEFTKAQVSRGGRIAVHCYAGMGRTNLMIASFLIHHHRIDALAALDMVRTKRPFHLVTYQQEEALMDYFYVIKESLEDAVSGTD